MNNQSCNEEILKNLTLATTNLFTNNQILELVSLQVQQRLNNWEKKLKEGIQQIEHEEKKLESFSVVHNSVKQWIYEQVTEMEKDVKGLKKTDLNLNFTQDSSHFDFINDSDIFVQSLEKYDFQEKSTLNEDEVNTFVQ